jgi:hypothetical protein
MRLLYSEAKTTKDTYIYQINNGGEFDIEEKGEVRIVFENGKFVSATFPFHGIYSRNQWRILAGITDKIAEIEERVKD